MAAGGLAKRIEYKIFNKHASADKNSTNIVCINGVCGPGYSGCGSGRGWWMWMWMWTWMVDVEVDVDVENAGR